MSRSTTIYTTMPNSFLDLPFELRDEIYKLIIPIERGANGEPLPVETDVTYWEDHPIPQELHYPYNSPRPTVSEGIFRLGLRLLRTCRQVNEEIAPYIYGQQRYAFYRPRQALAWLDRIGQHQSHLRHVAILGSFVPDEAFDDERQVQAHIWASVIRKLPNITSLSCLLHLECRKWPPPDWSTSVWSNETVLKAIRDLTHIRLMFIEKATRADGHGWDTWESSPLEPAFDQPFLETLVLEGHPIAGVKWYPEDYFDRLVALKNLSFCNTSRMQSGNFKVSNDFFSHIAPLRSFTWSGMYLTSSHRKAFTTRHGGTLQFLELNVGMNYLEDRVAHRSEESACLNSLTKMFEALHVLKALSLTYWHDCARLIESMPRSLTVLSLSGSATTWSPNEVSDKPLGHALRNLPDRCPHLAHVRLQMMQTVVDEEHLGGCGTLSIDTHAALEYMSSKIKDTLVMGCVARGCNRRAPMDPELTNKIIQCWDSPQVSPSYLSSRIFNIDLNNPWKRYYAGLESVIGSN